MPFSGLEEEGSRTHRVREGKDVANFGTYAGVNHVLEFFARARSHFLIVWVKHCIESEGYCA